MMCNLFYLKKITGMYDGYFTIFNFNDAIKKHLHSIKEITLQNKLHQRICTFTKYKNGYSN